MSQTVQPWVEEIEAYSLMLEKTAGLDDFYVAAGKRAFMVGDQNGTFPPLGFHVPGDMGGIWSHPIKLLDGFWLKLSGSAGEFWLDRAEKFVVGPGFYEHGYTVAAMGLTVTRREWVPESLPGLVCEFHFKNTRDVEIPLELEILAHVNLRATWRSEELQIRDGDDAMDFDDDLNAISGEDTLNGWGVVFGTDRTPTYHLLGQEIEGRQVAGGTHGSGGELHYSMDISARGWTSVKFFVAGSVESLEKAKEAYQDLVANHPLYFEEKMARYADVANHSRILTPEPVIDEAFLWAKLNFEMLAAETPVGNGLLSGFPEVPWFNGLDVCMSTPAALAAGRFGLAKQSLELLAAFSQKWHDGQEIPYEITTLGAPFQRTNLVALPLFVIALDQYLRWTGDRAFAQELLPIAHALRDRVLGDKRGLNMVPRGPGLVEKPGLTHRMVDVACLLCEGLRAYESLCSSLGDGTAAQWARRKHEELAIVIGRSFWLEPLGLFADLCAPQAEIQKIVDGMARRMKTFTSEQLAQHVPSMRVELGSEEAVPEGVMYGWQGRLWTSVFPMLIGAATPAQAATALAKMETGHFMAPWGMMVQGGLDKKVTPLGTGALACAQLRYGRGDQGMQTVKRHALSLLQEMPGAFAEYLPDQGCCLRAWSGMGLIWSLVHYVLGIRPRVADRAIEFVPRLPASWEEMYLDDVLIGELTVSFGARHGERFAEASVALATHGFRTFVGMPVAPGAEASVAVNGVVLRKWDTEERTIDGQRFLGAPVDLAPGVQTVRVEW